MSRRILWVTFLMLALMLAGCGTLNRNSTDLEFPPVEYSEQP